MKFKWCSIKLVFSQRIGFYKNLFEVFQKTNFMEQPSGKLKNRETTECFSAGLEAMDQLRFAIDAVDSPHSARGVGERLRFLLIPDYTHAVEKFRWPVTMGVQGNEEQGDTKTQNKVWI